MHNAPHLLDVDGDSCHHLHNAAKKFCAPFSGEVEGLFRDVYNDHQWSTSNHQKLSELCTLLSLKFSAPDVYIPWRYLSCYDDSVSTLRLLDVYTVMYYSFLKKEDQHLYKFLVDAVYEQKHISPAAMAEIKKVQKHLAQMSLTDDGKARKNRICQKVFYKCRDTELALQFYVYGLETLKKYVCLFQAKKPMIHKLSDQQIDVFQELLVNFIKPEKMPTDRVKDLLHLDVANDTNLLSTGDTYFGPQVAMSIAKAPR